MRWKYTKLLLNLGNAVQALLSPDGRSEVTDRARAEGEACLRAAGIDFASTADDAARRGDLLDVRDAGGTPRRGGSSWQSLQRRTGSIETDYLNGEIVLLGRQHGVPTPVNALLQALARQAAAAGATPGVLTAAEFLEQVGA